FQLKPTDPIGPSNCKNLRNNLRKHLAQRTRGQAEPEKDIAKIPRSRVTACSATNPMNRPTGPAGTRASRSALRSSQQIHEALRRRDGSVEYQSAQRPLGLELVVSAVCGPVRRGPLATLLQRGRTLVGRHSVLLLVS